MSTKSLNCSANPAIIRSASSNVAAFTSKSSPSPSTFLETQGGIIVSNPSLTTP